MIDFYTYGTPNGRKVAILLEELAVPYRVHKIDIGKGEQFTPAFVAINPNSKIPAIVDDAGPKGRPFTLFESGAILIYLAEKHGRFHSADPEGRHIVNQWLMFQMAGIGPMLGQAHHFMRAAPEKHPYGIERYGKEAARLYGVMNRRLGEVPYLAGADYTIADIATYPWVARHEWHQVRLEDHPNVKRWFEAIGTRPAVQRGMAVPG